MAFVAAQNMITFDGTDNQETYNIKVLRLVIKTLLEASEAEKTAHSRANAYWTLDSTRINGGDLPSEVGGSDSALYEMCTTSDYKSYGVFFKNALNETIFLSYNGYGRYYVSDEKDTYSISLHPIIGDENVYNDQSHIYNFNSSNEYCYGLGISVSKNNFGGLNYPWLQDFFVDGDLKLIADGRSDETSSYYSSGETMDVIVAIDGKKLIICRRSSYNDKRDNVLLYGDFISSNDVTDTQIDCTIALQRTYSGGRIQAMLRDKAGTTTFNPNGSNFNNMRKPVCTVNPCMIAGSNSNRIPYTGMSIGFENCEPEYPNSVLNENGIGYKGITDPSIIRVVPYSAIVQNKSILDDNGTNFFVIAQYISSSTSFSVVVPWDSNNPVINN
jgi:hypothetical protein